MFSQKGEDSVIKNFSNNLYNTGRTESGLYSDEEIELWTAMQCYKKRVGTHPKKAILKQLLTHFKQNVKKVWERCFHAFPLHNTPGYVLWRLVWFFSLSGVWECTYSHAIIKEIGNQFWDSATTYFQNLNGVSWEELLDFILRFLMRRWISIASVEARNNEFFELICFMKMRVNDRRWL